MIRRNRAPMPGEVKKTALNVSPRILVDTVTMVSGTLNYTFFSSNVGTTAPNNYKRNPFTFTELKVRAIRFSNNVVTATAAKIQDFLTGTLEIYKNNVSIFAAPIRAFYPIRLRYISTTLYYDFGDFKELRRPLIFRDSEQFEFKVAFATMTSTDTLSCELDVLTSDKLAKDAN